MGGGCRLLEYIPTLDYKQLYIFKGILMELILNIFVELPLHFSHFTRFFLF
jgi:hypothetical protein